MTTWTYQVPLPIWVVSTIISIICFAATNAILFQERRKRSQHDYPVASKSLSVFSYLCIIIGPIVSLIHGMAYLPGLCHVHHVLLAPIACLQVASMECYQLSRLYYCFSRNQVHSDKGYPKWVFWALFIVLLLWFILNNTASFNLFIHKCYIQSDGASVFEGSDLFVVPNLGFFLANGSYAFLEMTTVFLYWNKVRSLRKYQNEKDREINDRIQSILHRVLILTFLYLIIAVFLLIYDFATGLAVTNGLVRQRAMGASRWSFMTLFISYSMFLMQDHNNSEYIRFLQFVNRYKCTLCFCCFGSMVREQYRTLKCSPDEQTLTKMKTNTTLHIRHASADVEYGNNKTGMELSIATRTVCDALGAIEPDTGQRWFESLS